MFHTQKVYFCLRDQSSKDLYFQYLNQIDVTDTNVNLKYEHLARKIIYTPNAFVFRNNSSSKEEEIISD